MLNRKSIAMLALATCAGAACANRVDLLMFETNGVDPLTIDLWVDVIDQGATVDFVFHNDSDDGVISEIYFESTGAIGGGVLGATTGTVNFSLGATPPSPPGSISGFGGAWAGNLFSADADSPGPTNGIGVGETLTVSFAALADFGTIMDNLQNPDSGFRIAQHVISVGNNSIWTTNMVPAPGAAALLGLGGLFAGRRRR